jgi:hypothetical protein
MDVGRDIDPRAFRQALGQFATGVAVIAYRSLQGTERSPEWPLPMHC